MVHHDLGEEQDHGDHGSLSVIYAFGDYELDTRGYELRRWGEALPVAPQVLEFLAYLIQHQGQVISKAALLEELWPDRFVSDWALAYCVKAARRAIDDNGRTPQFIRTVRARGYCFMAPVEAQQAEPAALGEPTAVSPARRRDDAEALFGFSQPQEAGVRSETRHALLMGNGRYPHDAHLADLHAPERDVEGLAAALIEARVAPVQAVQQLKNVSHRAMLDALLALAQTAQRDDLVLVYISGHARLDAQGRLYFAAHGTQSERLGDTALALEQIHAIIDTCLSTRMILIFDCAFSTATGDAVTLRKLEELMRRAASGRGKYILSASPEASLGQDAWAEPHSVLTQYLIEGLRTGHADIDRTGAITVDQLYHYACAKVLQASRPVPVKWDLSGKGGLILARTRPAPRIPTASTAVQAHYDAIARLFKKGEVIPCLGPGLTEHRTEAYPPVEQDLARRLADAAGLADRDHPFPLIAQQVQIVAGRGVLYDNLRNLYQPDPYVYSPAPIHRFLARIPYPFLILSTTYDTLLEEAFDEVDKKYVVVTHLLHGDSNAEKDKVIVRYSHGQETVEKCQAQELVIDLSAWSVIYKLHGAFGLFEPNSDEEIDSLVVTEEDYLALVTLLEHPQTTIPNYFARQFKKCMFLFWGYGISDWNHRAVLDVIQRKGNFRRVQSYAICQAATEFERLYWESKRVRVLETDLHEFMGALANALGIDL